MFRARERKSKPPRAVKSRSRGQVMRLGSGTRLFLLLAMLVMSSPICAQEERTVSVFIGGQQLIDSCRGYLRYKKKDRITTWQETQQIYFETGLCQGYVTGVVDTVSAEGGQAFKTNSAGPICLPKGITDDTLTDIVARYVDQSPTVRHLPGAQLIIMALANGLPCKQ